jgi:hypothetical protein
VQGHIGVALRDRVTTWGLWEVNFVVQRGWFPQEVVPGLSEYSWSLQTAGRELKTTTQE